MNQLLSVLEGVAGAVQSNALDYKVPLWKMQAAT